MNEIFFPYRLHLHILQLEEYDPIRFLRWIATHFFLRHNTEKKKFIWTTKARALYNLSLFFTVIFAISSFLLWGFLGIFFAIILATQSYLFLLLSLFLVYPLEKNQKDTIIRQTKSKLRSLHSLQIIGITGSYGKTSTKSFLYHLLKSTYPVLKTPGSYNTLLGIAKVVDLELDTQHRYFICEMGAYKKGDIAEIAKNVPVDFALLTGLNEQHLERYGSVKNAIDGEFELIASLSSKQPAFINIDDELIKNHYQHYTRQYITYGFTDEKNTIRNDKITKTGTIFDLILNGKTYRAQTTLIGNSHLKNILAAATVAHFLGVSSQKILENIATLHAAPHRLEIKEQPHMTLIDDAYSSNPTGFQEALNLLTHFSQPKVLVTPGIIELGEKSREIHKRLGEKADAICDVIILVGKSERTDALATGIKHKEKIQTIHEITDLSMILEKLNLDHPVVLLENDLADNY